MNPKIASLSNSQYRTDIKFVLFLLAVMLVGLVQYAPVMLNPSRLSNPVLFQLDNYDMGESGTLRYLKDLFVAGFSFYWVLNLKKFLNLRIINRLISLYFIWIFCVFVIGLVGYLYSESPMYIMLAGIRWLMLLNTSVGLFLFFCNWGQGSASKEYIYRILFCLAAFEAAICLRQVINVSSLLRVGLGASRVPGVFSNAGVAAMFALSISMIAMFLEGVSIWKRVGLLSICLFIALASGTRFAMICIFIILANAMFFEDGKKSLGKYRAVLLTIFIPVVLLGAFVLFGEMSRVVNRGNMFESQLESGGRISNAVLMVGEIFSSSIYEIFFGAGIGSGTNTAFSMVQSHGIDPNSIKFNWLVDNSIITNMFQFGLVGSIVFWCGIIYFIFLIKSSFVGDDRKRFWIINFVFFVVVFGGNPFEQYYIMVGYFVAMAIGFRRGNSVCGDMLNVHHNIKDFI